jgi:hypothetical protein
MDADTATIAVVPNHQAERHAGSTISISIQTIL